MDTLAEHIAEVLRFAGADQVVDHDRLKLSLTPSAAKLYGDLYRNELNQHHFGPLVNGLLDRRAPVLLRMLHKHFLFSFFILADAVGLGIFSVAGTVMALAAGLPAFSSTMLGVVTGVFGGVLRDVILNEVPMVLRDGRPYATAAFVGCLAYTGLVRAGVGEANALWVAALSIVVLRMVAWHRDWHIGYRRH